jgi:hypothetical protein
MLNIYVDMDDVVADWANVARSIVGEWDKEKQERIPDEQWNKLRQHQRIYRKLPVRLGATELMSWLRAYCRSKDGVNLYFLTAVPKGNDVPWAFYDKVLWAQDNFPDVPVFFGPYSVDKAHRCHPGDILIDDRLSNCSAWRAAGGIAYQYKEWPDCKQWLEENLR